MHGGGDRISEYQRRIGVEPTFVGGRRVTTREDIEAIRMILSGVVNKELVAALLAQDVTAVGVSGEDGGWDDPSGDTEGVKFLFLLLKKAPSEC